MLDTIKKQMGINHNELDTTIQLYIDSAKEDLKEVGVVADTSKPIIKVAIVEYCLSLLDTEYAQLHADTYNLQKDHLRHYGDYRQ